MKKIFLLFILLGTIFFLAPNVQAEGQTCDKITVNFVARNQKDAFVPGVNFEVFEQVNDANNNPKPGTVWASGKTDDNTGLGTATFTNDKTDSIRYGLRVWTNNKDKAFYFYDSIGFSCGSTTKIERKISGIHIVVRDSNNNIKANVPVDVFSQRYDANNRPIKEKQDSIAQLNTGNSGEITLYIPQGSVRGLNRKIEDYYVLDIRNNDLIYTVTNIKVNDQFTTELNYTFSSAVISFKDPNNNPIKDKSVIFYKQLFNALGNRVLGDRILEKKTDSAGQISFDRQPGIYAAVIKDDIDRDNIFWNIEIAEQNLTNISFTPNLTRIKMADAKDGDNFSIYSTVKDENNFVRRDQRITDKRFGASGFTDLFLSPNTYLFSYTVYGDNKAEYNQVAIIENNKFQIIDLKNQNQNTGQDKFKTIDQNLVNRLKGYILLNTEKNGEAWYVNPKDGKRYYLKDGQAAYQILKKFGSGMKTSDLKKIIVGANRATPAQDTDGDGLADDVEKAFGTNLNLKDSDFDSFSDFDEITNGYNPNGSGKLPIDNKLANNLKGKILLQVQDHGEAWYVNPKNGRRYYINPTSAYEAMKLLSLGVKDSDMEKIDKGE
ncbi:MAG: thrombospondin type 3 repeat-containing protein [Planctomycetes bacterium]|nr:thrombospondin type 3 repeat-containing protein [Planctomycetota bacterium]